MSKIIRWTFFFEEGSIKSEIKEESEDKRISEFMDETPKGVLRLPGEEMELFLNLDRVKLVARQVVDLQAEQEFLAKQAEAMKAAHAAQQPQQPVACGQ